MSPLFIPPKGGIGYKGIGGSCCLVLRHLYLKNLILFYLGFVKSVG